MLFTFLDVPEESWIQSDHHGLLITIAAVSILVLTGIFIYRRKKSK